MKRNGSEIFFFFFRLFRIDAKPRNLKRKKNGMKRKQNEKEAKTAIIFPLKLNEAKRKRNIFLFDAKKCFSLVFTSEAK